MLKSYFDKKKNPFYLQKAVVKNSGVCAGLRTETQPQTCPWNEQVVVVAAAEGTRGKQQLGYVMSQGNPYHERPRFR